jgi:hypothetical protein
MKPTAHRPSRWRLLVATSLLGVLCLVQQTEAQIGRPPGGIGGNVGGRPGNVGGIPGNVGGIPGNVGGIPGNAIGAAGNVGGIPGNVIGAAGNVGGIPGNVIGAAGNVGGIPGGNLGGGFVEVYHCSRCNAQVNKNSARCPSCGARFVNGPAGGGWDDRPNGGLPIENLGGPPPITSGTSSRGKEDEGLSKPVIIGIAVGGFVLLVAVAILIVCLAGGSKPNRRKKRKRFSDYEDDDY